MANDLLLTRSLKNECISKELTIWKTKGINFVLQYWTLKPYRETLGSAIDKHDYWRFWKNGLRFKKREANFWVLLKLPTFQKKVLLIFFTGERILHLSDSWDHSINQKSPRTPEIYDFDCLKFFCLSLFDMFLVTMWSNENIEIEVFSHCRQLFSHFQDGSEKWIILETPICDLLERPVSRNKWFLYLKK